MAGTAILGRITKPTGCRNKSLNASRAGRRSGPSASREDVLQAAQALCASIVTGLTFVHELLDIDSAWPTLDMAAQLELISQTIELILTIEL
ncbi:hypothetical protein RCH23_003105 [Cryobacterium sp. CAN_C3]|nr:hypothetical protein [Cryobacterium sp. CAN_C3]